MKGPAVDKQIFDAGIKLIGDGSVGGIVLMDEPAV